MPEEGRFVIPDLQRIGKYDILGRIAEGGFATLYRARDPFLKRLVAIKVCASEDPELRQQFLREAEIAGNLDHPSIVRSFDFGFDQVGPYLVQEYLHGEDLSRLIERRAPLQPRRRLDLLIQIAEGLSYSHAQRVLHLDVKPANVRVLGLRQAKILDFGIARLATSDGAPRLGTMVGTAGYLPPEQVMGRPVDERADVFGFGALAYELLTYCRPFTGGTMSELLKRVMEAEADPITRHWPDCSDALGNLIGRCLRRDPAARYPSFDALLPELIAVRDSLPEVAEIEAPAAADGPVETLDAPPPQEAHPPAAPRPVTRRTPKRALLVTGIAAAAAAAVVALLALVPSREPEPAAPEPAVESLAPVLSSGPAPGVLLVTAVPWGEVRRVVASDGSGTDLPEDPITPLRLWVTPGAHEAEIALAGGEIVTCRADVVEGGTHLCHAAKDGLEIGAVEYWKEMGWWP